MAHAKNTFVLRNRYFFVLDILAIITAVTLSFLLRFDLHPTVYSWQGFFQFLLLTLPIQMLTFYVCGLYTRYWHDAGAADLLVAALVCALAGLLTILAVAVSSWFLPTFFSAVPRSIPIIDNPLLTLLVLTLRFSQRAYHQRLRIRQRTSHKTDILCVLIVGAGDTGIQVLNALEESPNETRVVGFLDDDPRKVNQLVHGVKVVGNTSYLKYAVQKYTVNLVIIAIPSAPGTVIRRIMTACQDVGVAHKIIPGLAELINGRIAINMLRPVSIDDLLRRSPVKLDVSGVSRQVEGKCVLITGAGGSIGSELARQVAQHHPAHLLLLGHGENSLFGIENRLKHEFPDVPCKVLLTDMRDPRCLHTIFTKWRPSVVFHAAAHKHVPMLEINAVEAVINNVIGTYNLISLCDQYEIERMIMVSTDKAVEPTSVMGMTKRVAEILMMYAASRHPRRFAIVRFGNVLGSRGSVVPTFLQQIADGGPVTVTSAQITRFFMSIPEAVRLVLKAGVLNEQGPLFVLNMGEPVRVIELAYDLIRLSGLEPDRDIEVKITGLRPGEKLYEELFWSYESRQPIEQDTLFAIQLSSDMQDLSEYLNERIQLLMQAARDYQVERVLDLLAAIVFTTPDEITHPASREAKPFQKAQEPQRATNGSVAT